jgi:Ankyrin repeats (3 copies)
VLSRSICRFGASTSVTRRSQRPAATTFVVASVTEPLGPTPAEEVVFKTIDVNENTEALEISFSPTSSSAEPDVGGLSASATDPSRPTPSIGMDFVETDLKDDYSGSTNLTQGPTPAPTEAGVSTAGMSPLDASLLEACYDAKISGIESALSAGADVRARDVNQRTAMHFCAGNGLVGIVKKLGKMGADINAQDILGLTSLHMATGYKKPDTVNALIEMGADANIACYGGELPVELAERLVLSTPPKKFFMPNAEYASISGIAKVLDAATEEEEGDIDEGNEGNIGGGARDPSVSEEEDENGTKFVVRVKGKAPSANAADPYPSEPVTTRDGDVSVTVRRASKPTAADLCTESEPIEDAHVTIRRRGEVVG